MLEDDFLVWTGERSVAAVSSNVESKGLPFQSWRPFKEAFAPEIIHRAIAETARPVRALLDPFGGSGTSALAAQFLGVRPTTIEVNPFLADLIEAKICTYDVELLTVEFANTLSELNKAKRGRPLTLKGLPPTFVEPGVDGRYIFSQEIAGRLAKLIAAIEANCSEQNARLLRVLTATIALEVSNVVISGKGRRYRKNWQNRPISADEINERFEEKVVGAIGDITRHGHRRETSYHIIRGDSRKFIKGIENQDVAVFSPPYPNSFDYTDVYNVELWLLGYLKDARSNRDLRNQTLRSHVQIKRPYEYEIGRSKLLLQTFTQLQYAREGLWSKDLPEMVASYFFDMKAVLRDISAALNDRGRVYCVVGDSRYADVHVPVARILGGMDRACGLRLIKSETFRSMRVSPQQGGRQELPETLLIFEKCL